MMCLAINDISFDICYLLLTCVTGPYVSRFGSNSLVSGCQESTLRILFRALFTALLLFFFFSSAHAQSQNLFFQPPSFPCNGAITSADFNQDGKPDLACADGTILLGKGDGTFATGPSLNVTGTLIATGDFNHDGKADLLVASFGSTTLSVFLGKGDGTFQPAVSTNIGASLVSIVVADLNGDAKPDVVGIVSGTAVLVLLGRGDGTFAGGVTYPVLTNSVNIATVGDFNGDGKPDIAIAAESGTSSPGPVGVLLGIGDGTFQPAITSTGVSSPVAIVAGDFNGDGKLDLAISDSATGETFTLLGAGNGSFQTPSAPVPAAGVLAVADLNADGKLDLVIGGNPFVQVFLGNGDGTFANKDSYLAGEILGVQSIVIADFNLDAKPDVATANTILLGNGDGSFQGNAAISFGNNNSSLGSAVAGDFNRDGSADIAVISSNQSAVNILLNDGTAKFSLAHTYSLAMPAVFIVAADLNQDGKLDLLLTLTDAVTHVSNLSVMLGNGDGSFAPPAVAIQAIPGVVTSAGVADFNGDHIPDLAVGGLTIYLGKGDGTFTSPSTYFGGAGPTSLVTGDFNNDGIIDVADTSSAGVGILLGKADGTFRPATFFDPQITRLLAAASLTGNRKLDLVASINGNLQVLLGNGDGTFAVLPATNQPVGQFATVADVNGDGKFDLVTGHGVQVLLGNGDGTFGNAIEILPFGNAGHVGGRGVAASFLLVADFNGDKRPDVAFDVFAATAPPTPATAGLVTLLNITQPQPPDFSISASALSPATVTAGASATSTITVTPAGAFSSNVAFSCMGLPANATCGFAPSSFTNGSGTSILTLTTKPRAASVMPQGIDAPHIMNRPLVPALLALLIIVCLYLARRGHPFKLAHISALTALALVCLGMTLISCGGGGNGGTNGSANTETPTGTFTIDVIGTSTSGSTVLTHTATLTLVVM